MSYSLMLSDSYGERLLSRYQILRQERRMCDIILDVQGKEFQAHRTLLACSSDYFWSLFHDYTLESKAQKISLPAVPSAGFEQVLDFIYTSWLSLSPSSLEDTLEAASYLQVTHALNVCTDYIMSSIDLNNCCFFANVATRYGLPEALDKSNCFIAQNMGRMLNDSGQRFALLELNRDSFQEVLGSEMSGVKELAVLHLVLDWLVCNPLPALESNSLLSRVRFGLVAPDELSRLRDSSSVLRTPFIHSLVQKALYYHMQVSLQPLLQSVHTSVRTTDKTIVLVGGGAEPEWPQTSIQRYDQQSKRFHSLSTVMPHKVQHQGVCVVGNFLFVLGGEIVEVKTVKTVTDQVWRYDPRFDRWEQMESLLQKKAQFSCCVVEGVIYAVGGRGLDREPVLSLVEKYNMKAGCWRSAVSLPYAVHGQACATIGRGIYISGGIHGSEHESSREVLFLDAGTGCVWEKRSPMSIARFGHQMAVLNERIYTFLGMYEPFSEIECYHPKQDHWTRLKPLLNDRFCYGLTVTSGNHVLIFGGRKWQDGHEVCTQNVLEYDPESDSWREVSKLPAPLCGTQCALISLDPL